MNKSHDVIEDGVRSFRLTCLTCDNALVKQPYMTRRKWREALEEFANKHPCATTEMHLQIAKNEEGKRVDSTKVL